MDKFVVFFKFDSLIVILVDARLLCSICSQNVQQASTGSQEGLRSNDDCSGLSTVVGPGLNCGGARRASASC